MALNDTEEAALRKEFSDYKANSVTKEVMQGRIDAKTTYIEEMKTAATAAATKHTELDTEFKTFKTKAETDTLLGDNGVNSSDARGLLIHRYNQLPEADRPDLAKWVGKDGKARTDDLVKHVFGTAETVDTTDTGDTEDGKKKRTDVPNPVVKDGDEVVKFTTDIVAKLGIDDRIKHHDQIMKDLGF